MPSLEDFEVESLPVSASDFSVDEEETKKNLERILAAGQQATSQVTGATMGALTSPAAGIASQEGQQQAMAQRAQDVAAGIGTGQEVAGRAYGALTSPAAGEASSEGRLQSSLPRRAMQAAFESAALPPGSAEGQQRLAGGYGYGESLLPIPSLPIREGEPGYLTVAKEAANIALGIPKFLTSPLGLTVAPAGAFAPTLTAAGFTADMANELRKQAAEAGKDWDTMTPTEKRKSVVDLFGTAGLAAFTGLHTVKGASKALGGLVEIPEVPIPGETMPVPPISEATTVTPTTEKGAPNAQVKVEETGALPAIESQPIVTPAEEQAKVGTPQRGGEDQAKAGDLLLTDPNTLVPALKPPEGPVVIGERGNIHDDIYKAARAKNEVAGLELQTSEPEHGFWDGNKFLSRTEAAKRLGEPGELTAQRLNELQNEWRSKQATQPVPVAATGGIPPVIPPKEPGPLPSPSAPDPLDAASVPAIRASLPQKIRDAWRSFSMQSLPKITDADRETGEAGVRMAASVPVAQMKGELFAKNVLKTPDAKFDLKFGTALTEDNLRSIKAEAEKAGQPTKVATLVGIENSPFKTEKQYQDFLNSPEFQSALQRHKELWTAEKDPLFRQANDLDPDVELASRGLQTGARVNLKAVQKGEGTPTTIGPARSGLIRQAATLKKYNPFARKATGLGSSYEGSYTEIMKNGFAKEYPVAKQHQFIKALLDSGNAVLTDKEFPDISIKGEATKGYLMRLGPFLNRWLQVRKSLAPEYQAASGLDPAKSWGIYTKAANVMTRQSIVGLAEGSTHVSNLASHVFTGLGPSGNPMLNALIKSAGRADIVYSLPKILINAFSDRKADMIKLAEIGAAKQPYARKVTGPITWLLSRPAWLIDKTDKGTRLYANDVYKKLADNGYVPNTETGLREFVNQLGQYNKKLQPALIRDLRDTGVQPFATAMQNFNVQGLRTISAAPGVKATSNMAALALRADKAASLMGFAVLVGTLKLGAVGWVGDDKKLHQLDLGALTGMSRGARITGIQPAIEALRLGLSPNTAIRAGVQGVGNTLLSSATGPLNRFGVVALTMVQEAKVVPPQDKLAPLKSQAAANIAAAVQSANPGIDFIAKMAQGKPGEAVTRQFSRYAPKTGLSTETIAALPKIVKASEIKDYADALAKEARKIPMKERGKWIMDRLKSDNLTPEVKGRAMLELRRKGAWSYQ